MSYTVTQLISNAYYSSSLVAREFETIQGYQLNDALQWLNELLLDNTVDAGEIPYITTWLQFNSTTAQEKYFLANLIDIQSIVFFIDSVRYEMKFVGRKKYFSTPRANNINALPLSYTYERTYGGVNLFLYFFPDKPYLMQIVGNMYMPPVSFNQDLTQCVANLGIPSVPGYSLGTMTVLGTGVLAAGELVINGVDVAGTYASVNAFVSAINGSLVPNVTATITTGGNVVLYTSGTTAITLVTAGTVVGNGITFANFSTTGGALSKTLAATAVLATGQLVVNGVDLAGNYYGAQDLINHINTGVVPNVTAAFNGNDFVLSSSWGGSQIQVQTAGVSSATYISFSNFSTLNGLYQAQYSALDQFYIDYLRYRLAARICMENNFAIPPTVREMLDIYRKKIIKMAEPMDLQLQKTSCLTKAIGISYAQANIGKGYTTNGGY